MANFAAMRLLNESERFTEPVGLLLAVVSGVPLALIASARVLPKERNWLRFPWYPAAQGGGAFVMVDRIYAHRRFFVPEQSRAFLLLLAHEVGHLAHAEPFGTTPLGRLRFVCWAGGHYVRSVLRHGRQAHRLARIEQEAERGRWVLGQAMARLPKDTPLSHLDDTAAMQAWIQRNAGLIATLHRAYPGWPLP